MAVQGTGRLIHGRPGWGRMGAVLVILRFRYDEETSGHAQLDLSDCLVGFEAQPGFVSGTVGRAVDDPTIWVLETRWANVGAYRRALSSYDIKMSVVPLLSNAIEEPSAYEVIVGEGATDPNDPKPRGT